MIESVWELRLHGLVLSSVVVGDTVHVVRALPLDTAERLALLLRLGSQVCELTVRHWRTITQIEAG